MALCLGVIGAGVVPVVDVDVAALCSARSRPLRLSSGRGSRVCQGLFWLEPRSTPQCLNEFFGQADCHCCRRWVLQSLFLGVSREQ